LCINTCDAETVVDRETIEVAFAFAFAFFRSLHVVSMLMTTYLDTTEVYSIEGR